MAEESAKRRARGRDVYETLRRAILHGEYEQSSALRPQQIASDLEVSLAVVRESLLRLAGEGLAVRLPNRGFAVPAQDAARWQQIAEARMLTEPAALRLAIERGDLRWESRVRSAHHLLSRLPQYDDDGQVSEQWSSAHRDFHRAVLEGGGNDVLLETFDRMWTASELARRWSVASTPDRDVAHEHLLLEEAALARDADTACEVLVRHLSLTASALAHGRDETNA
jgi:DNA-binding GntR family transcriptional regulator